MRRLSIPETESGRLAALLVGLVFWLGTAILLGSLLSAPLYSWLDSVWPGKVPFIRLFRRLTQIVAFFGLVLWMRRRGVRNLAGIGFERVPGSGRLFWRGMVAGVLALLPAFGFELLAGNRSFSLHQLTAFRAARLTVGAPAIGLLEEGVCRGALLFPFAPLAGVSLATANVAVSSLFSIAHFARGGDRVSDPDIWSGLRVWRSLPQAVADHFEAAVGLFLAGALFYVLAARQGHVWGAAGLHTGAVLVLQLLGTATTPIAGRGALFLVDGILPGWGLSALLAVALAIVVARSSRRPAAR